MMAFSTTSMPSRTKACNKSTTSFQTYLPKMLSIIVPLSMLSATMRASAFAPYSSAQNQLHTHHSITQKEFNARHDTVLFAQKKKVPKMPTLPVSTTTSSQSSSESSSAPSPEDKAFDDFYSTSKPAATSTMVVMDVENIRGATSFRISHEALLSRIRLWREDRLSAGRQQSQSGEGSDALFLEPLIWICDHGTKPSTHHFPISNDDGDGDGDGTNTVPMPHNFGAMFAGPIPGRTADDVIVELVELRCGYGLDDDAAEQSDDLDPMNSMRNNTIVITADARLISRCQQARRKSSSLSDVIFVEPTSLLQQLERYRINSVEEESLFGTKAVSLTMTAPDRAANRAKAMSKSGKDADGKTSTMTSFKDSTIAMEQHNRFQARFGKKKGSEVEEMKTDATNGEDDEEDEDEEEEQDQPKVSKADSNSSALAAQLKTEQIRRQMLLSDAYYLARPSKNVRGRRAHTTSAAVHAKYKTRNISKKQQKKLYQKRFGNRRKEDMATAAMRRKELAVALQMNLGRAIRDSADADCSDHEESHEMLFQSKQLLAALLGKFEAERSQTSSISSDGSSMFTAASEATTILGLDNSPGKIGSDDKWDPLAETLNVPLREDANTDDKSLPPLRMVVISDTHGFEGALSRFAESNAADEDSSPERHHAKIHSDEFLLPQADVLLHCGDFAASGSRKTQRQAARRLDDFLARQTHIPEKIVVKGNHDPDSPAKVLFPASKALYVRSSSTLMVNGVSFTLEPFSRRMAFRSIRRRTSSYGESMLPKCDVLVTHEPPKGVLDLTYHGFSAGSLYLRQLVEQAEEKPRLWCCGHIHESRGVITRNFRHQEFGQNDDDVDESKDASTMVINASNANSGRANRLVSGAVLVEVERQPCDTGGDETAQSTVQSQRVNYAEDSANGSSDGAALSELGEDLEVYVTRPGVRRRKGVPQSMRQQMKNVRASLVMNESNSED